MARNKNIEMSGSEFKYLRESLGFKKRNLLSKFLDASIASLFHWENDKDRVNGIPSMPCLILFLLLAIKRTAKGLEPFKIREMEDHPFLKIVIDTINEGPKDEHYIKQIKDIENQEQPCYGEYSKKQKYDDDFPDF